MAADRVGRGDVEDLVAGEVRLDREDDRVAEVVHVDVRAVVLDQHGRVADDRAEVPLVAALVLHPARADRRAAQVASARRLGRTGARRTTSPSRTGPAAGPDAPRRSAGTRARNGRCAKMNPGTVSLEKFTNRRTPRDDRRLEHVERAQHVVAEDDVRRVVDRLRDRGRVHDDVAAARRRAYAAPGVGQVGLPVVLGLARLERGPRSGRRGRSRARRSPPRRAAGTSARPTLPRAPVTRTFTRGRSRRPRRRASCRGGSRSRSPRSPAARCSACSCRYPRSSVRGGRRPARSVASASSASSTTQVEPTLGDVEADQVAVLDERERARRPPTRARRGGRPRRTRCRSCARRRCARDR